jgi:catechol-2,3-dioxygenase
MCNIHPKTRAALPNQGADMNKSDRCVNGLGEVSLCVKDLDAMQKFYEEVVGLQVLRLDESFVFFKVAEGYGGHSQNLALFENKSLELNPDQTTLHHIALNVALEDFESEKMRLESLGLKVDATLHEWLHVRSLYFYDPEGNHLEFVAYDETVR